MKGSTVLIAALTLSLAAFGQSKGTTSGGSTASGATATGVQGTTTTGTGTASAPSNNTAGVQPNAAGMNGAVSTGTQGTTTTGTGTATAPSDNTAGVQPLAPGMTGSTGSTATSTGPLVTNGGYVTNGAPVSAPILVAPIVHLGSPTPGAGASNSTNGLPVGATSNPGATLGTPSPVGIVPEIATGPAQQGGSTAIAVGPPAVDRGVGEFSSIYDTTETAADGRSLAELAAQSRTKSGVQSAHVYTNADVDRMNEQTGATGGITGAATNAGNSSTPGAITGGSNSVAQPAGAAQPQTTPGVATPVKPQANPIPHEQSQLGARDTSEMAQANPPARPGSASAAQDNTAAQNTSGENEKAGRTLPRASSPLPLVAVLGFFAAAGGMFLRR